MFVLFFSTCFALPFVVVNDRRIDYMEENYPRVIGLALCEKTCLVPNYSFERGKLTWNETIYWQYALITYDEVNASGNVIKSAEQVRLEAPVPPHRPYWLIATVMGSGFGLLILYALSVYWSDRNGNEPYATQLQKDREFARKLGFYQDE